MGELFKTDMNGIYRQLIAECRDGFPEVLLFSETDFPGNIARYRFKDGRSVIHLRHGRDDARRLIDEILSPQAPAYPAEEWMYHSLSDEEFPRLACAAVLVSEILGIECPQVGLCSGRDTPAVSITELNLVVLDTDGFSWEDEPEWVHRIAHEARHLWQYKHHPEYSESYICEDAGQDAYLNQPSELDAEAFAGKLLYLVSGLNPADYYTDCPESVRAKVKARMETLTIRHENVWRLKGLLGFADV
ncbi:MAG: hypothetical protein LUG27_05400 [Clostridiales bacterium]|nr:hypothetical protein [Clostridiales bacterium]